jgi:hypothetical protein
MVESHMQRTLARLQRADVFIRRDPDVARLATFFQAAERPERRSYLLSVERLA